MEIYFVKLFVDHDGNETTRAVLSIWGKTHLHEKRRRVIALLLSVAAVKHDTANVHRRKPSESYLWLIIWVKVITLYPLFFVFRSLLFVERERKMCNNFSVALYKRVSCSAVRQWLWMHLCSFLWRSPTHRPHSLKLETIRDLFSISRSRWLFYVRWVCVPLETASRNLTTCVEMETSG